MDIQRIIAFVVFSFSLLLLWENWQQYNNPRPVETSKVAVAPGATAGTEASADVNANAEIPAGMPAEVPPPASIAQATSAQNLKGARAKVITDVLSVEIDANGGDIRDLQLTNYRETTEEKTPLKLFEEKAGRPYYAQMGFVGGQLPTHKAIFQLTPGEYRLKAGEDKLEVPLTANINGVEVVRTYVFHRNSYVVDVKTRIANNSTASVSGEPYYQLMRHGQPPEGESALLYTYTGPAIYTDAEKFQKASFEDIEDGKASHSKRATDGWVAIVQHHFFAAWLTEDPADKSERAFFTKSLGNDLFTAGVIRPAVTVNPGQEKSVAMRLYAGPQELSKIEQLAPGLDLVVDYGWLTILAYPIFIALSMIYSVVQNWGVAIIILTILIKLVFYPLSAAGYKSMAKMRKLAPRLQHLKERYGDDRQKQHEQMMKIYKEEKINPLGGCLPILVQIPVFIALYWALLGAVELREAPFALWITDLSQPDPYYVLPILMAITSYIQVKLSPTALDPVQQKVMMAMPVLFSIMFIFFPAGLVLYWFVNNILSILQQWRINVVIEGGGKAANDSKH
jgi:YidC/Oxa1 family membrane protein insertase